MTPQEQSKLDSVFGRVHVKTPTGGLRPLAPVLAAAASPVTTEAPAPTVKSITVAVEAPKYETSPVLESLKRTLPEMPANKKLSRPAD